MTQFGALREDHRIGMLCALLANVNRRKGAKAFKPSDFFPWLVTPEDEKRATVAGKINAGMKQLQKRQLAAKRRG